MIADLPPPLCERTYTVAHYGRAARKVLRHPSQATRRERAQLRKFRRCARRPAVRVRMVRRHRRWLRWRRGYRGRWTLASERLSPATHAMLARLRGCETRGIPYPANYRYVGTYGGAYQYGVSAWTRAGGTWPVWGASKDEQDARTAWFYPSHRGEWACSA